MFQQNYFNSLPLLMQWNIINAYNNTIQQEQMVNIWKLYSILNSKQTLVNNSLREIDVPKSSGYAFKGVNQEIKNLYQESYLKKSEEHCILKEKVELSNGNYNVDMNETMPITPIKKQKENKFFITKKRNRETPLDNKPIPLNKIETVAKKIEFKMKPEVIKKEINKITDTDDDTNLAKKAKIITHIDYQRTKSQYDFMKYNFNYDLESISQIEFNEFTETTIPIPTEQFGLLKKDKEMEQCLPKKIWSTKDLKIDDKQLKKILKTFEANWPKKFTYDEEMALKVFTLNKFNSDLTVRYFASEMFKNLLTYSTVQKKYHTSIRK